MSYSDSDIEDAVTSGAISRNEADRLLSFLSTKYEAGGYQNPSRSEENFRLSTGFNDIFISVILMLVLWSLWYMLEALFEGVPSLTSQFASIFGISRFYEGNQFSTLATAALAWVFGEYFTKKRRMALPSILLMLVFTLCVFITFFVSYAMLFLDDALSRTSDSQKGWPEIVGALGWIAGVSLHWLRFRVPISFAIGMTGLIPLSFGILQLFGISFGDTTSYAVMVALGGLTLFAAIWWDSRNTLRITREADVAFWLHILAAPLIVHPIFARLGSTENAAEGAIVLAIYLVLCLISIVLDRRAFMVIALGYSVYAAKVIFTASGFEQFPFAVAAFSIGGSLLLLSIMWHPVRRAVMTCLPQWLARYFPPA